MILYCAGAIRGNVKFQKYYKEIIEIIGSLGHTALSELNKNFISSVPLTDNEIFKRDMKWLSKSRALIAEISGPSTGVGFEIAYALYKMKIPVLALANTKTDNLSALLNGCNSNLLQVRNYGDEEEMREIITGFIEKLDK